MLLDRLLNSVCKTITLAKFKLGIHYGCDGGRNPIDPSMAILDFKVTEVKK